MSRCHPIVKHPLVVLTLALAVAVLVPASCGGSSSSGGSAEGLPDIPAKDIEDMTGKKSVTVEAVDNSFEPRYLKVSAGTKIEFTNTGNNAHNVLADDEGAFSDITTGDFGPGATGSVTFGDEGTFGYYCSLHGTPTRGMNGRIIVEG